MIIQAVVLFLLCGTFVHAALVQITQGTLNGTILRSRNGSLFHAFYGIPYAQPPIGELRFQPPKQPSPSWEGIKDVSKEPAFCPQINFQFKKKYSESEDCLFLHVFTHEFNPPKLIPVLVYFHSGGLVSGSGTQLGPHYFMDKHIVVVMVNSRLGVFGYFSAGDSSYPGNNGLKDQVEALKWIWENIPLFGGDPSAVTIMGHGSGAGNVHLHTLSPLSKDLFQRAIIQSGAATHNWFFTPIKEARNKFQKFQQHTNCLKPTAAESVTCLRAMPAEKLLEFENSFISQNFKENTFRPTIELPEVEEPFLTTNPNKFVYPSPRKPLIFGFTSNEAVTLNPGGFLPKNLKDERIFYGELPGKLDYNNVDDPALVYNITTLIKKLYFGNDLSNINSETICALLSDLWFKFDIVESIRRYPGLKYAYEYDYNNQQLKGPGIGHGEDLKNLFPSKFFSTQNETETDRKISETMITYWSNFILIGDPNTPDEKLPTKWTHVRSNSVEYLYISNNGFELKNGILPGKDEFWEYCKKSQKFRE